METLTRPKEFVGIIIDLRVAETIPSALQVQKSAWEHLVAEIYASMSYSIAEQKVEVRIINADGSVKDTTFAELEPHVTY